MNEFDLIRRYFTPASTSATLGIGDDCALISAPSPGVDFAITTDMLVEGRHFPPNDAPEALGHKVLAVNLSDIAAMGAKPRYALLSLALPDIEEAWIKAFCQGFFALAKIHDVALIGGDTTRGPLKTFSVTLIGEVPSGQAIRRSGAKVGDDIWVSGTLGVANLGLQLQQGKVQLTAPFAKLATEALERPTPRIALGLALRGIATAMLDVSDGLTGDLTHLLKASGCGATINADRLPFPTKYRVGLSDQQLQHCQLAGGDDYELCFTAAPENHDRVLAAAIASATPVTRIGTITKDRGLRVLDVDGIAITNPPASFDHFTP